MKFLYSSLKSILPARIYIVFLSMIVLHYRVCKYFIYMRGCFRSLTAFQCIDWLTLLSISLFRPAEARRQASQLPNTDGVQKYRSPFLLCPKLRLRQTREQGTSITLTLSINFCSPHEILLRKQKLLPPNKFKDFFEGHFSSTSYVFYMFGIDFTRMLQAREASFSR